MKSTTIAALTALLSTGALAVPFGGHGHNHAGRHAALHHHLKRDNVVWITEFEVETVTVMKTVYGDGSQPTGAPDTVSPQSPQHLEPAAAHTSYYYPPSPPEPTTSRVAATYSSTTLSLRPARPTTSSYVAPPAPKPEPEPTTTTSVYQAPPPPATTAAPTTPPASPAPPAPSSTYGSGGSSGGSSGATGTSSGASYKGDATYYDPGLGACGITSSPQDDIVAISWELFGTGGNPNANPLCGRTVTITGVDGNSYTAKVVDRCTGCKAADLDMTPSLFNKVTNNGDGRVHNLKWTWN